jgi:putative Mg2+ transporter-C (MgtC) family protein
MEGGNWFIAILASEFADLRNLEELVRILLRIVVAALLGGVIGLERELAHKTAGLRTHMMVAMASALFVLAPLQSGFEPEAMSRVVQGIVAGIGFLCAGAILKSAQDEQVRGLTTSAGLFMAAAIGVAAGLGREGLAVLSAILALVTLRLEGPVSRLVSRRDNGRRDTD